MNKLFDGEMLAGKAITGYKIQTPGGQIAFFNTHVSVGTACGIIMLASSFPWDEANRCYFRCETDQKLQSAFGYSTFSDVS